MKLLNDVEIRTLCAQKKMITPFLEKQRTKGKISFGVSSFGYDLRVADRFKIFTNVNNTVVDPKNFDAKGFVDVQGNVCVIPQNSFALARSVEYFKMPDDVIGVAVGKSTYARCGIITNVTPLEPGWEGYLTIEISNTTPLPAKIYANEGIVQVLFFQGERPKRNYTEKGGKYHLQKDITVPRV